MKTFLGLFALFEGLRDRSAYGIALFIYQQIYCRYWCVGECIIHDGARELAVAEVCKILHEEFNTKIHVTLAGRPQLNGQAESYISLYKRKVKNYILEKELGIHFL